MQNETIEKNQQHIKITNHNSSAIPVSCDDMFCMGNQEAE